MPLCRRSDGERGRNCIKKGGEKEQLIEGEKEQLKEGEKEQLKEGEKGRKIN